MHPPSPPQMDSENVGIAEEPQTARQPFTATGEAAVFPGCVCGAPITHHPTSSCNNYRPSRPLDDPTDIQWFERNFNRRVTAP